MTADRRFDQLIELLKQDQRRNIRENSGDMKKAQEGDGVISATGINISWTFDKIGDIFKKKPNIEIGMVSSGHNVWGNQKLAHHESIESETKSLATLRDIGANYDRAMAIRDKYGLSIEEVASQYKVIDSLKDWATPTQIKRAKEEGAEFDDLAQLREHRISVERAEDLHKNAGLEYWEMGMDTEFLATTLKKGATNQQIKDFLEKDEDHTLEDLSKKDFPKRENVAKAPEKKDEPHAPSDGKLRVTFTARAFTKEGITEISHTDEIPGDNNKPPLTGTSGKTNDIEKTKKTER